MMYSESAAAVVFALCVLLESGTYGVSGYCDPGESNYTTIVTVNKTERVPGRESKIVKTKSCDLLGWSCDTRYKAEYYNVMKYTLVQDKIIKEECCPGYSVAKSSLCIQSGCLNGTYGDNCTHKCSCPENAYNNCDQETGNCTCLPGWHGTNCTEVCDQGHYGKGCQSKCECEDRATCDPHTGHCTCPPGWDGHFCEKACANETYGNSCNETCRCTPNQMCDHVTGNCDMCVPGIRNPPDCDKVCPQWRFGQNCSQNCSCDTSNTVYCDVRTGKCECYKGYRGIDCEHECLGDTFGFDCLSQCQCNSNHSNGTCDSCSGACHCHTDWTGYTCDIECPAYMVDTHCQSMVLYNNCEPYNITWSCSDGWTGKYCDKVCDDGRYGSNCSSNCTCNSKQECNPVTGQCTCKPGYTGDHCTAALNATEDDEAVGMLVYILAAGGAVLLAACVLAAVVCLTRRKRRETNKTVPRANHAENETQTIEQHTMNDLIYSGSAKGNTEMVKQIHDGACKETGRLVIADNTKPDTPIVKMESLYEVATADTTEHLYDGLEHNGDENQIHDEPKELLYEAATRDTSEHLYEGLNHDEYVNVDRKDDEHSNENAAYENCDKVTQSGQNLR